MRAPSWQCCCSGWDAVGSVTDRQRRGPRRPGHTNRMVLLNLIAVLAALAGLLAAAAHGGYLALLGSAANRRAGSEPVSEYVRSRVPVAVVTLGVALLALVLAAHGPAADILAILAGAGSGVVGYQALQSTRTRYRSGG